nr:hypothetical protein GCM10020063_035570 [Dactylosporangium thailandense]
MHEHERAGVEGAVVFEVHLHAHTIAERAYGILHIRFRQGPVAAASCQRGSGGRHARGRDAGRTTNRGPIGARSHGSGESPRRSSAGAQTIIKPVDQGLIVPEERPTGAIWMSDAERVTYVLGRDTDEVRGS